jgi:hypothetical protein
VIVVCVDVMFLCNDIWANSGLDFLQCADEVEVARDGAFLRGGGWTGSFNCVVALNDFLTD